MGDRRRQLGRAGGTDPADLLIATNVWSTALRESVVGDGRPDAGRGWNAPVRDAHGRCYQRDGVLTFTDWMNLFNTAAQEANDADPNDETLNTNLNRSLQRLVANVGGAINTIPYVVNLANQVL